MKNAIKQAIAISQIAGCEFTKEELTDLEKVERGELSFDDIEKNLFAKVAKLKKE